MDDSAIGKSRRESPLASPAGRTGRSMLASTSRPTAAQPPRYNSSASNTKKNARGGGEDEENERRRKFQVSGGFDSGIGSRHGTSAAASSPLGRRGAGAQTTKLQNEQLRRERVRSLREQCRSTLSELSDSAAAVVEADGIRSRSNDANGGGDVAESTRTSGSKSYNSSSSTVYHNDYSRDISLDNILGIGGGWGDEAEGETYNFERSSAVTIVDNDWRSTSSNLRSSAGAAVTTTMPQQQQQQQRHGPIPHLHPQPRRPAPAPTPRSSTASDARWSAAVAGQQHRMEVGGPASIPQSNVAAGRHRRGDGDGIQDSMSLTSAVGVIQLSEQSTAAVASSFSDVAATVVGGGRGGERGMALGRGRGVDGGGSGAHVQYSTQQQQHNSSSTQHEQQQQQQQQQQAEERFRGGTQSPTLSVATDDSDRTVTSYATSATATSGFSSLSSASSASIVRPSGEGDRAGGEEAVEGSIRGWGLRGSTASSTASARLASGSMAASASAVVGRRRRFQGATGVGTVAADAAIAIANESDVHLADRSKQLDALRVYVSNSMST
eukprot:gene4156-2115_t